jgi:hypothetical protein
MHDMFSATYIITANLRQSWGERERERGREREGGRGRERDLLTYHHFREENLPTFY